MSDNTEKSRVLTLVFTDLADSTALKTERGDQAVGDLIQLHREYVTQLAGECNGRIIDWAGDGCFLTFETSSAAVTFSLRLEQIHADHPELPGVRIGVHMGEVTERPGPGEAPRIEGLAVDIAARISGLAIPGQVLMSASVHNSARHRLGVETFGQPILWQAHGTYELKGLDEPMEIREAGIEGIAPLEAPRSGEKAKLIRRAKRRPGMTTAPKARGIPVWATVLSAALVLALGGVLLLRLSGQSSPSLEQAENLSAAIGPIASLAVLPLTSLSDDVDQEYLAAAITDSITSELAKIKALKVISNSSATRYKKGETDLSLPEIAAELNVDALIEGSMLREGDDIRITVQLIHGASDAHVWSESYTYTITSVMKLQSDVALAIADAVGAELTGEERRRIATTHDVNPEAYEALIIGQHYLNDITKEGLFTAIDYFQQAVEIDPEYAHAWGGMVCAYWEVADAGLGRPREIYPKARSAGIRALQLNDDMSTDHSHLGMVSMGYDHEWEQAEERFVHAVDLSPSDPVAHGDYAQFLEFAGRTGEALEHASTSLDLNPNPRMFSMYRVLESIYLESNPERALRNLERLLAEQPNYLRTLQTLTRAHKYFGAHQDAIAAAERWVEEADDDAAALTNLALALADGGQAARARNILEDIGRIEGYFDSAAVGYAYISLDELDTAFEWLETGYDSRDWAITRLRTMPYWKIYLDDSSWIRFRNDPRYRDLIARVGFPPLPPEHAGYADEQAWLQRKAAAEEANAPIRKIAVLPFDNMMRDPEQEYFVDGMTEALITELAQIKSLQVRGRTSVMQYKGTMKTIPEIARELDVDGIIEGSVMREGDEVRITARLIHGPRRVVQIAALSPERGEYASFDV